MSERETFVPFLADCVRELDRQEPQFAGIWVYGSLTRGKLRGESDFDLVIVLHVGGDGEARDTGTRIEALIAREAARHHIRRPLDVKVVQYPASFDQEAWLDTVYKEGLFVSKRFHLEVGDRPVMTPWVLFSYWQARGTPLRKSRLYRRLFGYKLRGKEYPGLVERRHKLGPGAVLVAPHHAKDVERILADAAAASVRYDLWEVKPPEGEHETSWRAPGFVRTEDAEYGCMISVISSPMSRAPTVIEADIASAEAWRSFFGRALQASAKTLEVRARGEEDKILRPVGARVIHARFEGERERTVLKLLPENPVHLGPDEAGTKFTLLVPNFVFSGSEFIRDGDEYRLGQIEASTNDTRITLRHAPGYRAVAQRLDRYGGNAVTAILTIEFKEVAPAHEAGRLADDFLAFLGTAFGSDVGWYQMAFGRTVVYSVRPIEGYQAGARPLLRVNDPVILRGFVQRFWETRIMVQRSVVLGAVLRRLGWLRTAASRDLSVKLASCWMTIEEIAASEGKRRESAIVQDATWLAWVERQAKHFPWKIIDGAEMKASWRTFAEMKHRPGEMAAKAVGDAGRTAGDWISAWALHRLGWRQGFFSDSRGLVYPVSARGGAGD